MLAVALAIKLDSPGPVFFKQRRHGYNHRLIYVYKFRTMHVAEDGAVVVQARKDDDRVTRVGKFLRRTSIDELPQLFNVLKGEMSLVGPRPHAVAHNQLYCERLERYANRHCVKPGMTGWAQIHGFRGPTEDPEKMRKRVQMDLYYIENWSICARPQDHCADALRGLRPPQRLLTILVTSGTVPHLRRRWHGDILVAGRRGFRASLGEIAIGGACGHARVRSGMSLGNARRVSRLGWGGSAEQRPDARTLGSYGKRQ